MSGRGGPEARRLLALAASLLIVLLLFGLGVWQVQRLFWKTALIARVEQGLTADPVAPPGPQQWASLSFNDWEYRRISATGHYLPGADILVQAVTVRGPGFWVMTPFESRDGVPFFVNRGFVPSDRRNPGDWPAPEGEQTVKGLLRMSQEGGAFLRANNPAENRWFSRDTAAMAAARGLAQTAPYFLDLGAGGDASAWPIGGLTVVSFPNNHLVYALTWFTLSGGAGFMLYRLRRSRNGLRD